jgi:hypothetical protein
MTHMHVHLRGNRLGIAVLVVALIVGALVGSATSAPIGGAVGAGVMFVVDLVIRLASGNFDERGGHLYGAPVWIIGFAVGFASIMMLVVK